VKEPTTPPMALTLAAAELGLEYGRLSLVRTRPEWVTGGAQLAGHLARVLAEHGATVEHVGSTSVHGLLAKPIVDVAVGIEAAQEVDPLRIRIEQDGWIYRGDAGDEGGHVFVLESQPWFRVAHVHVVPFAGEQWLNYLRLRDLLRDNSAAREAYETTKLELANTVGNDRMAYTDGKTDVVRDLLGWCT
jgi:GrpB-like predicted nucleotidyltransferase (UPF0157 family)